MRNKGGICVRTIILTDSASDLSPSDAEKYGFEIVPLQITKGEETYRDRVDLTPERLFREMREGAHFKTSQPSVGAFIEAFREHAAAGRSCLYIGFSSKLSGTVQSAELAKQHVLEEFLEFELEIVDSLCASTGLGLTVIHAAEMAAKGAGLKKIAEAVRWRCARMEHIFTVDNLEYLQRGGRIGTVAAFIGSILNIKPILHVEEGKLVPLDKVRGRRRVIPRMVELMAERGANARLDKQLIGICHGDDQEAADELKAKIAERFGTDRFYVTMIGAAVGAHAGPGTLSVFFLNEAEPE